MPSHTHTATFIGSTDPGNAEQNEEGVVAERHRIVPTHIPVTGTVRVEDTGGSQAHPNMQPYVAIHWIICTIGTYPEREGA